MRPPVVLLGPQRFRPTVRAAIDSIGARGPVAVVTAGWQERESEHDELRAHLDCEVVDLLLYRRFDDVLLRDRELAAALDQKQRTLREVQGLYRLRLHHVLAAARALVGRAGQERVVVEQRQAAIRDLRRLDREHLRRLRTFHGEFEDRWSPAERTTVARHREQLTSMLQQVAAVCIAGGHVTVLLNRMRIFGFDRLTAGLPVVAWSAGAMAISDRVVLFHDSPPQGAGDPELLDAGLGLAPRIVALPHARRRLRLGDPARVALFARRFAPSTCVVLEPEARLDWDGRRWSPAPGTLGLGRSGKLRNLARRRAG